MQTSRSVRLAVVLVAALAISLSAAGEAVSRAIQFNFTSANGKTQSCIGPAFEPSVSEAGRYGTYTIPNGGGESMLSSVGNTVWNNLRATDTTGNKWFYSNNDPATGVKVWLASGSMASGMNWTTGTTHFQYTEVRWTDGPNGVGGQHRWPNDGSSIKGVANTVLGSDVAYATSGNLVGFRVQGLAQGYYMVYVIDELPVNEFSERQHQFYVSVTAGDYIQPVVADKLTIAGEEVWLGVGGQSGNALAGNTNGQDWVEGRNYIKTLVYIGSEADYLNVICHATAGGAQFNGVQIIPVAVPEPATMCLLALGGLAVLRRRRGR